MAEPAVDAVDAAWQVMHYSFEFDYFRRTCAAEGDSLATTLRYVVPHWRSLAVAEGRVEAEAAAAEPWVPLRGPMFVPDPRGGPGCIRDM